MTDNETPHEQDHGVRRDTAPILDPRSLLAEGFGTFALTFVAAGGEVIDAVSGGQVGHAAKVTAPGLLVLALIYAIGDVSGAHVNPAVTFAFAVRGAFAWRRVPGYWVAQMAGALLAAGLLRELFGTPAHLGATMPHGGTAEALVLELVLTTFLVAVILGTANRNKVVGPNAALAVGATIVLDGLFAGPISGASMNPARSLGPAALGGALAQVWIYILGPVIGALLAVGLMSLLRGRETYDETEAASGEQEQRGRGEPAVRGARRR